MPALAAVVLGQCCLKGSPIDPLRGGSSEDAEIKSKKQWAHYIEEPRARVRDWQAQFTLIGVASRQALPKSPTNLLTIAPSRHPRPRAIRQAQNTGQTTIRDVDQLRACSHQLRSDCARKARRFQTAIAEALQANIEQRASIEVALQASRGRAARRHRSGAASRGRSEPAAPTKASGPPNGFASEMAEIAKSRRSRAGPAPWLRQSL
jgi:hypothetical protein